MTFTSWWKQTTPGDVATVVLTGASLTIAIVALVKANNVAEEQAQAAAPILAPGTPPQQRGRKITVVTEYPPAVRKRADHLFLDRGRAGEAGRFVVPLRNGGLGIGLTIGIPVIVANCESEPAMLTETGAVRESIGTYIIPAGGSEQLGYLEKKYPAGSVPGRPNLWYSFDYKHFKPTPQEFGQPSANLLIWYTDGAQHKLRWTCIQYLYFGRQGRHTPARVTDWAVLSQHYGVGAMVKPFPATLGRFRTTPD